MSAAAAGKARSARRRAIECGRHAALDMAGSRKEANERGGHRKGAQRASPRD